MTKMACAAIALLALLWLGGGGAFADSAAPAPAPATATGSGETFVPATAPPEQAVPGGTLLVWAYAGIWTMLLVLLGAMWLRQDALRKQIDLLRERLGERGGSASGGGGSSGGGGAGGGAGDGGKER